MLRKLKGNISVMKKKKNKPEYLCILASRVGLLLNSQYLVNQNKERIIEEHLIFQGLTAFMTLSPFNIILLLVIAISKEIVGMC